MKKTYMRYAHGKYGKGIGAVAITFEDGLFGVGVSMCHPGDRFDKAFARDTAIERSEECLKSDGFDFTDLMKGYWVVDLVLDKLPKSATRRDAVDEIFSTALAIVDEDIIVDFARIFAKSFKA